MEAQNKFAVMTATMTHNELLHGRMARQFYTHDTQLYDSYKNVKPGSLLAASYNHLWCNALANRERYNFKYLAILHADIVPEDFWIDKLIEEAELYDADIMSAVVAIKEVSGVTSTAISGEDTFTPHMRLTQRQINDPNFPMTFDIDALREVMYFDSEHPLELAHLMTIPQGAKLLVNTGCCVIRVDRPWCDQAYFTINDRIRRTNDGAYAYEVESEDWFFSRLVAALGGRVMATKAVITEHIGSVEFRSDQRWGDALDVKSIQNRALNSFSTHGPK